MALGSGSPAIDAGDDPNCPSTDQRGVARPLGRHCDIGALADICKGSFKNNPALQLGDFNTTCSVGTYKRKALTFTNTLVAGWYEQSLLLDDFQYINLGGVTQFRLRFTKDDNNDFRADFLKLFSGNALLEADRPQLIVEYYVPQECVLWRLSEQSNVNPLV